MAFESRYWRSQVKRDINFLIKKIDIDVSDIEETDFDKIFSQIEIKLFTVTYSLRKLMDTNKFPDLVSEKGFKIKQYSRNDRRIKPFGMFIDYYTVDKHQEIKLSLRKICNQFIHAYFFQPMLNNRGHIKNLFFVSDYDKNNCLYSLDIKYFLNQVNKIIDKYPKNITSSFDEKKMDYIITCK